MESFEYFEHGDDRYVSLYSVMPVIGNRKQNRPFEMSLRQGMYLEEYRHLLPTPIKK